MYESPAVFTTKNMSTAMKIGQLVMPRIDFNDTATINNAKPLIKKFGVGGFIIFNGEINELKQLTAELQSISNIPLLFGCDAERGLGQIARGGTYFPFFMSQGAVNKTDLIKQQAKITAKEMAYCGLNLIFAPVLDINSNPDNPIINIRSLGDKPNLVAELGCAFISAVQKYGILACAKHFPGHGGSDKDSHRELPTIKKNIDELLSFDLIPFEKAIEYKVSCIMPAHISFPNIDETGKPATLSNKILNQLLRDKLGFNGLIISDSFKMDALEEKITSSILAINAGVDIILDPDDPFELIEGLIKKERSIQNAVNSSVTRLGFFKGLLTKNQTKTTSTPLEIDSKKNKAVSRKISRDSVCKTKGEKLNSSSALFFGYHCEEGNFNTLLDTLNMKIGELKTEAIDEFLLNPSADAIICALHTKVVGWTNKYVLPDTVQEALLKLKNFDKEKIVLNFGSPYVLTLFDFFDTIITTFDITEESQKAVANILTGKKVAKGVMPVDLPYNLYHHQKETQIFYLTNQTK